MHIHNAPTTTPWPAVPFAGWRLWDAKVTWLDLEPHNGEWHFERLDQCVALAQKHNVDLLLPLGLSPAWASARPDEPSPYYQPGSAAGPKLIEDWRKYVSTIATRYKGQIRNYEIWNEPNLPEYWSGTTPEYVNLVREASVILRAIDPTVTIVGPSATNRETGPPWFDEFLSIGGGTYLDVLAHHLYVYPSAPEASTAIIDRIQQIMAKHGLSYKPLWNTELGWSLPTVFSSDMEAAAYVARAYILNWVAGVQRCYWYAWDNQEWATLWLTEDDEKTLTPAAIAYMEIQKWLVGARMTSCTINSDNTYTCQLRRDDGSMAWIVWNPGQTLTYPLPQAWRITQQGDLAGVQRTIQGGTDVKIGIAPLLLRQ